MFTLKKKIGTPSIKIRNTFKLKKIYIFVILSKIYIFVLLSSKKKKPKKKFVTEQNNGRQAQHQTHGKPNRLQRKQTHSSQKKNKKKKKTNTEQISTLETSNQYIRNH